MGRAWMRWRSPAQKDSLPSWNAATMRNLRGGERRTPSRPDRRHRRSRYNLQPYSSIKMEALLWCDCSLDTFTWSALRFPVAGPEHGAEYTSPGSRSTRAFWQRRRRRKSQEGKNVVICIILGDDYTLWGQWSLGETQRHRRRTAPAH